VALTFLPAVRNFLKKHAPVSADKKEGKHNGSENSNWGQVFHFALPNPEAKNIENFFGGTRV
jgi:hypothetical protein